MHDAVDIADVQIGADRIGSEAALKGGDRLAEPEAAGAMPEVEDDAAFARFKHEVGWFVFGVQNWELLGVDVGVDVAGLHLTQQFLISPSLAMPEIDHQRLPADIGGFQRAIDGRPRRMRLVKGLGDPIVRGFDADAVIGIGEHDRSGQRRDPSH